MISDHDLEVELRFVRAHAAGSLAGVFGPDSVTWRVNREAAIFLGAGRALLLQLAHPWVATAVAEHSQVFADPIGRFRRTFKLMFTMVFGTLNHALGSGTPPFPAGDACGIWDGRRDHVHFFELR